MTLPAALINDGRLLRRDIRDQGGLRKQLSREKISSPREVFLLTLDEREASASEREREA